MQPPFPKAAGGAPGGRAVEGQSDVRPRSLAFGRMRSTGSDSPMVHDKGRVPTCAVLDGALDVTARHWTRSRCGSPGTRPMDMGHRARRRRRSWMDVHGKCQPHERAWRHVRGQASLDASTPFEAWVPGIPQSTSSMLPVSGIVEIEGGLTTDARGGVQVHPRLRECPATRRSTRRPTLSNGCAWPPIDSRHVDADSLRFAWAGNYGDGHLFIDLASSHPRLDRFRKGFASVRTPWWLTPFSNGGTT